MIYGWKPDIPDFRDLSLRATPADQAVATPPVVDLRPGCPPVVNQHALGACTANAVAAALLFAGMRQATASVEFSRLFIYYNTRVLEGTVQEDTGAQIRNAVKSVEKTGACLEVAWPYMISRFRDKPDRVAYYDAALRQAIRYARVPQRAADLEQCLAEGFPITFGFAVFTAFEIGDVARTGILAMPTPAESMVGGHAVLLVGYNRPAQTFLVRNSYGAEWGQAGYFEMPYAYVLNPGLADDFWVIREVEGQT